MDKIIKIASAALNQTPLDWESNLDHIISAIKAAREQKAELLCLPELCITGYGCEDLFLSAWVSEKAISLLGQIQPHCENITVALGLPVWYKNKNFNCACVISDKKILGIYAKQFLANDGVHYESRWFTAWEPEKLDEILINGETVPIGDCQFNLSGIKVGFEICEDAWRSNRPACRLVEKGVKLILNPSASHFSIGKSVRRKKLIVDSSKTFSCTYVYANLLGNEAGRMIYDGELLITQEGRLIQQNPLLSYRDFNLATAEVNFSKPSGSHTGFKSDRPDRNEEFIRATSLALFDYMRKSRTNGFVISLSGGADSSTSVVIVAEMIRRGIRELGLEAFLNKIHKSSWLDKINGKNSENPEKFITGQLLTCVYQASKNSSEETRLSASSLAKSIGAEYHEWSIDDEVASYVEKMEKTLGRKLTWEKDDITLQNIQARARSPVIWMMANIKKAVLLATSNRSEADVGYATMDGDTSGSLAPIAGIDKYFIRKWLKWAEDHLGYSALHHVNSLRPSAELRPSDQEQTDESDLMPYKVLLEIEKLAIYRHLSPVAVYRQLLDKKLTKPPKLKEYIIKFYQLWSANQWKRERFAPAFHLDDFNVDPRTWCRFPILSGSYREELEELKKMELE